MNSVMTIADYLGLKFSDLVDITHYAVTKKSTLYESFDGSIDCYLVPDISSTTMSLEVEGQKSEKILELETLVKEASYAFVEIKNPQKIYCQLVTCETSRHYSHYKMYAYTASDDGMQVIENLRKELKGKGWAIKKAPQLPALNNTMTKRFISKMIKDIFKITSVKSVMLASAFDTHGHDPESEIVQGIYNSILETGKIQLLNHYNPDRHDVRLRRRSARVISNIRSNVDLSKLLSRGMTLSLKILNVIASNTSGSNIYDDRAFKAEWNRVLRDHRKQQPEVYNVLCEKYCLNPEDDNPIKSSLSSVVVDCRKTGLLIKTPSRFRLFNDLEKSAKEKRN